jgi:hypothetical protein
LFFEEEEKKRKEKKEAELLFLLTAVRRNFMEIRKNRKLYDLYSVRVISVKIDHFCKKKYKQKTQ